MIRSGNTRTTPLTATEVDEFFDKHLPYRQSMLLTHKLISKDRPELLGSLPKELRHRIMVCNVEASLIASRMFIEFLGLGIRYPLRLVQSRSYFVTADGNSYEVKVVDLGGHWVELTSLSTSEQQLIANLYVLGHVATAHLTYNSPFGGQWQLIHEGVDLVSRLLKEHLYDVVGKEIKIQE